LDRKLENDAPKRGFHGLTFFVVDVEIKKPIAEDLSNSSDNC
jgi:hypothetical protein